MFIKRKILPTLEAHMNSPEAIVLTGFRRVGKSTIIKHLYDNLNTSNKLFLDMESPVNQRMFEETNYDAIFSQLKSLGLAPSNDKIGYVFMDEIQYVKQIPSAVKYLIDHYRIKFVLTGSSSFYLKNHFTESLSGRKFLFELMPLDFEEFLWFKEQNTSPKADYHLLRHLYDEYLEYGGLPGVVLAKNSEEKRLKLDDALGSYFQLDVASMSSFRDTKALKSILFLLAPRVGSKLDITKLSETLGVSRQTIYNYLNFLEQTYLIRLIPAYAKSSDVIIRKVSKLYFCDTGLLSRAGKVSLGQVFENTICHQLYLGQHFKHHTYSLEPQVFYFQKKTGAEIDFIADNIAYEVKVTGTERDLSKTKRLADSLDIQKSFIVTLEKNQIESGDLIYPFNL